MGKRTSYPVGTFSWVDLATSDVAAAKSFYTSILGWEYEDRGAGGGVVYTMCRLDGDVVAGMYEMQEDTRTRGVGPHWMSYVTVEDADGTAARAAELGGPVVDDAFDVLDVGRMAVLRDPQGAVFAVWEPRTQIGAQRVNDVGCLVMNELSTPDEAAARSFYGGLFGWTIEGPADAAGGPVMLLNDGRVNGAIFAAPDGSPPHWRPCFTVESAGPALERVRALGGQRVLEPVDIGHGSLAMARDPQGALFSIFSGEIDD
jgi:predicted enzyme related to lactoylglutathione lyase